MNTSTLKFAIIVLILTASFTANATGGGKKPDPSLNRVQCWYSPILAFLPISQNKLCLINNKVKR